jgi:hypothetical protein
MINAYNCLIIFKLFPSLYQLRGRWHGRAEAAKQKDPDRQEGGHRSPSDNGANGIIRNLVHFSTPSVERTAS